MRAWFYSQDGQEVGPLPESELVRLLQTGKLPPDTWVWSEGMDDWLPAHSFDFLVPPAAAPPPGPPPSPEPPVFADFMPEAKPSDHQVRPWMRYWARVIDLSLFVPVGTKILLVAYVPSRAWSDMVFGMALMFLYVFIEPMMLSVWGTTPGKALCRVRLRKRDGSRISYEEGFVRSLKIFVRGLGLGIPIIAVFTQLRACHRLNTKGITSWDEEGAFEVTHQPVGFGKVLVLMFLLSVIISQVLGIQTSLRV